MSNTKSLFISAVFNLVIKEDLGHGIEIWDGIKLTNNTQFINSLINESLSGAAGRLETNAIRDATAVFYSVNSIDINYSNHDDFLCNYMAKCKIFLNDLWLVKDNCADLMMGYIQYPYFDNSNVLLLPNPAITHSNLVSTGYTNAEGNNTDYCEFKLTELQKAIEFHSEDNRTIIEFSESSKKLTSFEKSMPRISVGSLLTQTARIQNDLGLKIAHYCTALESLVATDNAELSHKLSERIAYFLEDDPKNRKTIYQQVKNIYKVRSRILHGSTISKVNELSMTSIQADIITRRILIKLLETPELDKYFRKNDNNGLDKYMLDLIFGQNEIPK